MALTRNFLKSMNLTDEQVNAIIESHAESIEGLTQARNEYKAKADQADALTRQLNEANEKLVNSGDAARIQKEFDDYKAGIEAEKTAAKNHSVMDVFLRDQVGVKRESARKLILEALDMNKYPQENGQLKNAEAVASELKTKYLDATFCHVSPISTSTSGVLVNQPPFSKCAPSVNSTSVTVTVWSKPRPKKSLDSVEEL